MKLFYKYMVIVNNLSPTSSHLHPLQAENCDSNSRLVVDEMTMENSGLKGLKRHNQAKIIKKSVFLFWPLNMSI